MGKSDISATDMEAIKWVAENENNSRFGSACRVLLELIEEKSNEVKVRNVLPQKRGLTDIQRSEIVRSKEPPEVLMKRFNIKFKTLYALKAAVSRYKGCEGSMDNWFIYKGMHAEKCIRLSQESGSHQPRHFLSKDIQIKEIVDSNESPSILIARFKTYIGHIRAVKRGYGCYREHGGGDALWGDYYCIHKEEIDLLLERYNSSRRKD